MIQERSGPMHFFRQTLMDLFIRRYPGGGTALDAGCGDGAFSARLAKKGLSVYGVDCSEEWCDSARKRIAALRLGGKVEIMCSSLEKMDFAPGSFDVIVCGEVLEHVRNDEEVIRKFRVLLKSGGELVLSVPLIAKGFDISDVMVGHVRLYEYAALERLLSACGFRIEKKLGWGYPFSRIYHDLLFVRWADRFKDEDEIRRPTHCVTAIGKSRPVSIIAGLLFFVDIVFTPPRKGIGIMLRARKYGA